MICLLSAIFLPVTSTYRFLPFQPIPCGIFLPVVIRNLSTCHLLCNHHFLFICRHFPSAGCYLTYLYILRNYSDHPDNRSIDFLRCIHHPGKIHHCDRNPCEWKSVHNSPSSNGNNIRMSPHVH